MKQLNSIGFVLIAACLWACSAVPSSTAPSTPADSETGVARAATAVREQRQRSLDTNALNEKLLSQAQINSDPGDYILGAGDLIEVEVFEDPELKTKARISSRGFITLPLLGQVKTADLTAREAETRIEELYRQKYIKDPHVSVFVEEHFSQRVTLIGQFKNPGTYDYPSKQSLLDVIALGGGVTDKAARTIQIRRVGATPGKEGEPSEGVIYVDMDKLAHDGEAELNIEINGGDVIFVPEAGEFFVDGAVRRPGAYQVQPRTNLKEAIVAAGGLLPYATKGSIHVVRKKEEEQEIITLDLTKLENWTFPIQEQDIIVAEANFFKKIWYGFQFGFLGTSYRDPER